MVTISSLVSGLLYYGAPESKPAAPARVLLPDTCYVAEDSPEGYGAAAVLGATTLL